MNKKDLLLNLSFLVILVQQKKCNIGDSEYIIWDEKNKLEWQDFQGPKRGGNFVAAESSVQIKLDYNVRTLRTKIRVQCQFFKKNSWYRDSSGDVLRHEQGHFDIGEIISRQLRKQILENFCQIGAVKIKVIDSLYRNHLEKFISMQNEYDRETRNSQDIFQQNKWEIRIGIALDSLADFANQIITFKP